MGIKPIADNAATKKKGAVAKKIKLLMKSDNELLESKKNNFFLLSSTSLYDNPMRVDLKKNILKKFNERPDNVYGDLARIIVMDSGFKEGIDLFDIKYVHIYEPQTTIADQKQVIGRGTRTCGQKGLKFHPTQGWPLHVYKYDVEIPERYRPDFNMASSAFDMYLKSKNMDIRVLNLTTDMEKTVIYGSVDYELNRNVHMFSVEEEPQTGGGALIRRFDAIRKHIDQNFKQYSWDKVKMENLCGYEGPATMSGGEETSDLGGFLKQGTLGGAPQLIKFSPTQDFISNYFRPQIPLKGMLLYQSVGTGKTCTAIATATKQFEPQGYTILWVTRTTLRNDIWKNMFEQICNAQIRLRVEQGMSIPEAQNERMRLLSKAWSIRPISYKQFSNLVSKKNALYKTLVKKNGEADPLRKTLLIIDEAHKLFGGNDLSSIERPDTDALHAALMNSYIVSGNDSARLMLMTATPITQDPMEMVKLLNLCRLPDKQIPNEFNLFAATYLDEHGFFTEDGKASFLDHIAAHVSYLNREGDARQFARPIMHEVMVPLLNAHTESLVKNFDKQNVRTFYTHRIDELKKVIENHRKTKKVSSKELSFLKNKCALYIAKKSQTRCKKLVNTHIKHIMDGQKQMMADVKTAVNAAKKDIADATKLRKSEVAHIVSSVKSNPDKYEEFKDSFYNRLRSNCINKSKDVMSQKRVLESHPSMISIRRAMDVIQSKMDEFKLMNTTLEKGHKKHVLALRHLLKTELSDLERNVVLATIRDYVKRAASEKKELNTSIKSKSDALGRIMREFKKKENYIIGALRKTAKVALKQATKAETQKNKQKQKEMKELVQSSDELGDHIRETVKDHEALLAIDLEVLKAEDAQLAADQKAKEADKEAKAAAKEANAAARAEKAAEKALEKANKENEKQRKAAAVQAEKELKAAEKARVAAEKEKIKNQKEAVKAAKELAKIEKAAKVKAAKVLK
jgi:hypothetical protein